MSKALADLERSKALYGDGSSLSKLEKLGALEKAHLPSAKAVLRLHELLCFLRAYPDDAVLLEKVEAMLQAFDSRPDLRRHREALVDSGIAGTEIHYTFFAEMAKWLVSRWPECVTIDWEEFENSNRLERVLHLLALYGETPGLDECDLGARGWVDRMRGDDETDGAFLVRRYAALRVPPTIHEMLYQDLALPLRLAPGTDTPTRTRARVDVGPIHFQRGPIRTGRPTLATDALRAPLSVRAVSPREGQRLIDLAREAMVTRSRDLDVFAYGDARDVRLVDCGEGLQFAVIGAIPERRLLLESVYGFVTLKNGVPIGYVLNSALFGSAEIAYNVFETYRGAEAAHVYGRVLATVRHLFKVDTFTIYPYQLGDGNEEGLLSGAWWFYQKLGFVARDPEVLRLMRKELARIRKQPKHRSSLATLRVLAQHNVYFSLGRPREDVIGVLPLSAVGLAITDYLASEFGSDRERGEQVCAKEAARRVGLRSLAGFSAGERLAWKRWAPLVMLLPGVERWSPADRRDLVKVVRCKGGQHESEFAVRFDAHTRLRRAVRKLAETGLE